MQLPDLAEDDLETAILKMVRKVYAEKQMPPGIDKNVTSYYAKHLWQAVTNGYGKSLPDVDYNTPDHAMLTNLATNVYHFSAAKNYQQLKSLTKALVNEDGKLATFSEFKRKAYEINDQHVKQWLVAEYNLAVAGGQMAATWSRIEQTKNELPLLKYITANDDRVRQSHADLEGIVRPVNDGFWNLYYPPNGWGCRCDVMQLASGKVTPLENISTPENVPDMFKVNLGKQGLAFPDGHPYFDGLPDDIEDEAESLMPITDFAPAKTIKEAKSYAQNVIKETYGLNIPKVKVSSELTMDEFNKRNEQLFKLSKEYNISSLYSKEAEVLLSFNSTSKYNGFISHYGGTTLKEINFGHVNHVARMPDEKGMTYLVKLDNDRHNSLKTLTHEFAHLITTDHQIIKASGKDERIQPFWRELGQLRNEYHAALAKVKDNPEKLAKIHLGKYAGTNANEFMAEGFTQYKLNDKPSLYAQKVGELIDKYFKK